MEQYTKVRGHLRRKKVNRNKAKWKKIDKDTWTSDAFEIVIVKYPELPNYRVRLYQKYHGLKIIDSSKQFKTKKGALKYVKKLMQKKELSGKI